MSAELERAIDNHERWRTEECLNLIPSENVSSRRVRGIFGSDLGCRYTAPDRFYLGSKYADRVETIARQLVCEIFRSEWACVTPISGHMADMALLSAFAHAGDSILSLDAESGGYVGISEIGYPRLLGLKNLYFPFDRARWSIRVDETVQLITSEKPRLVVLGASFIVFPHPVQQLKKACLETGAMLTYDASHVLGLIAGGVFQDPLGEGAKVLVGSTHKSFFGPQGGIIAAFETEGEKLGKTIYPAIVDNAHWNRIAALAVALLEIRKFGRQYARQVVRNSRALAEALDDDKVPVRCREYGYTQSHQLLLNTDQLNGWERIPDKLEDANVIVDRGIRLGTSEMTRRGMREREMNQIAAIIGDVIHGRRTPREAKRRAMALAKRFRGVCYC